MGSIYCFTSSAFATPEFVLQGAAADAFPDTEAEVTTTVTSKVPSTIAIPVAGPGATMDTASFTSTCYYTGEGWVLPVAIAMFAVRPAGPAVKDTVG